ncbi:MAG: porin [Arenicella sp.]|nr:porin [Arenicella sp.]
MRTLNVAKFVAKVSTPMILMASLPAEALDLNYESLSSLEQPLAAQYADVTFSLTGLIDAALNYRSNDEDSSLFGNFQVGAETQLANSWTLGAAYFAEYSSADNDNYSDNAGIYLGGVWGTVSIGNVTGLVREQARRTRGIGNASLDFDDQLGQLDDTGLAYVGRFGATQLIATIDGEGGYEIAGVFQRPIGNKDCRLSLQYRDSKLSTDDTGIEFDSKGLGLVAEITYASSVFDFGVGLEQISTDNISANRKYVSFGAAHKVGVLTFSVEAHFGDTDGNNETSYAAGLSYDIARGMSVNAGLNYSDAQVDLNGFTLLNEDQTEGTFSFRYSF